MIDPTKTPRIATNMAQDLGLLDALDMLPTSRYGKANLSACTNTTGTTTTTMAQSLTSHIDSMLSAIKAIGPEPIGEWMRSQKFPPEDWILVMPDCMRDMQAPTIWPSYVRFSAVHPGPFFVYKGRAWLLRF